VDWTVEGFPPKYEEEVVMVTEHRIKESGPNEEIETAEEDIAPMEISQREMELEEDLKALKVKFQRLSDDRKEYKGSLWKEIHDISKSLCFAKCKLKRVKPMWLQLEHLYSRNLV